MRQKIIKSIILFLTAFISVPIIEYFPVGKSIGMALIFIYPLLFITGLTIAIIYFKTSKHFKDKLKHRLYFTGLFVILIVLNWTLYPCGAFCPTHIYKQGKIVLDRYNEIELTELFEKENERNFLLKTAICYKFDLPEKLYSVEYRQLENNESTDMLKSYFYFIYGNQLYTDNADLKYEIRDSLITLWEQFDSLKIEFKSGLTGFEHNYKEFDNCTASIGDTYKVTGVYNNYEKMRVHIWVDEPKPTFDYCKQFERLFLKRKKKKTAGNKVYEI